MPFAVATVVWRRSPSSAKVGARALVTVEGQMRGWLAGACAEPAVIGEAKKAIAEGAPRLVFIGPPEEIAEHARDGVTSVPIACQSEGALEVYVEPVLPNPQLIVIGRSPAVDALARMAGCSGWRTVVVDDGGSAGRAPGRRARRDDARPGRRRSRRRVVRGGGDAGPLRRGGARAGARDGGDVHRAGRLAQARRRGAGVPSGARIHRRAAGARARAGRDGSREHRDGRDRRGGAGRPGAAARRGGPGRRGASRRRAPRRTRRSTPSAA